MIMIEMLTVQGFQSTMVKMATTREFHLPGRLAALTEAPVRGLNMSIIPERDRGQAEEPNGSLLDGFRTLNKLGGAP